MKDFHTPHFQSKFVILKNKWTSVVFWLQYRKEIILITENKNDESVLHCIMLTLFRKTYMYWDHHSTVNTSCSILHTVYYNNESNSTVFNTK